MVRTQAAIARAARAFPLAAACAGALLVLLGTPQGASTSPDSLHYLSVARNLLAGQGLTHFSGQPVVLWAPLYPMLLAGVYGIGDVLGAYLPMLQIVRVANALLFALVILSAWRLLRQHIRSEALAMVGLVAVVTGYPLLFVAQFVWTELLFVLLTLLFFLALQRFLRTPAWSNLLIPAALAALAAVLRYPGVAVIALGAAALLSRSGIPPRDRLRYGLGFTVVSAAPIAAVLIRNWRLTRTLMGERPASTRSLQTLLDHTYTVIRDWLVPAGVEIGYLEAGALGGALLLVGGAWLAWRHGRALPRRAWRSLTAPLVLWTGGYTALIVVSEALRDLTPIDDRYLAPIYVPLVILVLAVLDRLRQPIGGGRVWRGRAIVALALVWLLVPITRTVDAFDSWRAFSRASDRTYSAWHTSDLMRHVQSTDVPEGQIVSNAPMHLLIHAGIPAAAVPETREGWSGLLTGQHGAVVIWFDDLRRCDFSRRYCVETSYARADLVADFGCAMQREVADGAVLRCGGGLE